MNFAKFLRTRFFIEYLWWLLLLIKKYKSEYDDFVTLNQDRIHYNDKLKRHTEKLPKEEYMARAVREFYLDLKDVKHNDPHLSNALNSESDTLII